MSKIMANEWLKSAQDDLNLIAEILGRDFLTNIAAFHAQQAVEKSFKAVLEFHSQNIPKKHDLVFLAELVNKLYQIDIDEDLIEILNSLYLDSRYPSELGLLPNGKPSLKDIDEFYDFALSLHEEIKKYILQT